MSALAAILTETAPKPPIVLGVRLLPYTVGHALVLQRLRSPYVFGGEIDARDLVEAVFVCSQNAVESAKTINSIFRDLLFWLWSKRISKMNPFEESNKFNAWLKEQSTAPEVLLKQGCSRKQPAMPWPERVLTGCVSLGFTSDEVLNFPIGDAERFILTHAEMNGQAELWDEEAESIWQYQRNN